MNINNSCNVNFLARNKTIRFADDIARKVNREFPIISSTKVEGFKNIKSFYLVKIKLNRDLWEMRNNIGLQFLHCRNNLERVLAKINPIIEEKRGNCGELANLAVLMARINGIKNCNRVYLIDEDGYEYDHAVAYVDDKNPYIIDPWLGFADHVPNAIKRYQKEFRHFFDFDKSENDKMLICDKNISKEFINKITSEDDLNAIKNIFPQMLIKKKN